MCELREARLDEEDAAMELGRAMDALKKDRESLAKKERLMDQSLKAKSPAIASLQTDACADMIANISRRNCKHVHGPLLCGQKSPWLESAPCDQLACIRYSLIMCVTASKFNMHGVLAFDVAHLAMPLCSWLC